MKAGEVAVRVGAWAVEGREDGGRACWVYLERGRSFAVGLAVCEGRISSMAAAWLGLTLCWLREVDATMWCFPGFSTTCEQASNVC